MLQTTELGVGRDKLFIRGIADSVFNGLTQSTATTYFGDVPLGYAGPDRGLALEDVKRIEVLEGPQGTLYGAGAIGGIVRVTPNAPDPGGIHASASAGTTLTQGARAGGDASAMVNLPFGAGISVRAVGYGLLGGGYIDDRRRGLHDINTTRTFGGRVAVRLEPGNAWTIELGGAHQSINADDSQYAQRLVGPLARAVAVGEPYASAIDLARAVVTKRWDNGIKLVSATGVTDVTATDRFDSGIAGPSGETVYQAHSDDLLISTETRLSWAGASGASWVLGVAALYNRDYHRRAFGPIPTPTSVIEVANVTHSVAVFGEDTVALTPRLAVTLGARVARASTHGEPAIADGATAHAHAALRLDPTIGVSWLIAPEVAAYARAQTGYRTSGSAVAQGVGVVADYRADRIVIGEVGVRKVQHRATGVSGAVAFSYAHWQDIQADLFNGGARPFTTNIGDADIYALEATGQWTPIRGLRATVSLLATQNHVASTTVLLAEGAPRRLPETAPFSANLGIARGWDIGRDQRISLSRFSFLRAACSSASRTKVACAVRLTRQPTMRLANTSMTNAT